MASSEKIHQLVNMISLPWSWFISDSFSHPSLSQIEGSRIVLKDGISVLATHDLVSWWPFICLSILFYAVIPRIFLSFLGFIAQRKILGEYQFTKPIFRQLKARMTSPVVDIESRETPVSLSKRENAVKHQMEILETYEDTILKDQNVAILVNKTVYDEDRVELVEKNIKNQLCFKINTILNIVFDIGKDTSVLQQIDFDQTDGIILVYEVWQPPIRGIQFYITQLKSLIPESKCLWIYLTCDAGSMNLAVQENDINFITWKRTISKLKDPEIIVKRFIYP
jgi:hypothetical protein